MGSVSQSLKSSVIKQKGESQNGGNKKTKHAEFSEKRRFLTPWYVHVWRALLSSYLRFEIRSFALLPTIPSQPKYILKLKLKFSCIIKVDGILTDTYEKGAYIQKNKQTHTWVTLHHQTFLYW